VKLKNVAVAPPFLDDKAVNSTIFLNSLKLKRNILLYLPVYCIVQQHVYKSRVHDVEELLDIWHGLQQSAVDSAIDGERIFAPGYGPKEDIFSSDTMLVE